MSRLAVRLAKLERLVGPSYCACAVVRAPVPANDEPGWAEGLLASLGWEAERVMIWVVDGAGPAVLLPVTPYVALVGDAERTWLEQSQSFPQAMIGADGGTILTLIMTDEADRRRQLLRLEGELAGPNVGGGSVAQ